MQVKNDQFQIRTWCCLKKGISSIKCQVEKSHYFPGETVQITFEVDNSNCNIEKLKVQILKELQITDGYSSSRKHFKINQIFLEGIGLSTQIQPVQKLTCQLVQPQYQIFRFVMFNLFQVLDKKMLSQNQSKIRDKKKLHNCHSQNVLVILQNFQNPAEQIQPTTNGNWVKSFYFVKIKPHYEGCIIQTLQYLYMLYIYSKYNCSYYYFSIDSSRIHTIRSTIT